MPKENEPVEYIQKAFTFEEADPTDEQTNIRRLHESLAPYVDTQYLRQLAARQLDLHAALRVSDRERKCSRLSMRFQHSLDHPL